MHLLPEQTATTELEAAPLASRVRVACPKHFELCVTFDMVGASWDFVNSLHAAYEFEKNWPDGMLCHITGEMPDGIRSQGIWTTAEAESAYFRDVAVNVITQAMADLGPAAGKHGAVDFEPVSRSIEQLIIGPLFTEFQEIGPDLDASAIQRLGTSPVALDTKFEDAICADIIDASRSLGLRTAAPEGLILLLDECDAMGTAHQTQVWRSLDEAHGFWNESFLPALIDVGAVASEQGTPTPLVRALRRISVGSKALDSAWRG